MKERKGCEVRRLTRRLVWWMAATGIVWLALALTGCSAAKPVVMERKVVRTDTLYRERVRADTMTVRDSVFVWQYAKGDTVYREKTAWRWRERVAVRTDTVYMAVAQMDSARIERPSACKAGRTWRDNFHEWLCMMLLFVVGAAIYAATSKTKGKQ